MNNSTKDKYAISAGPYTSKLSISVECLKTVSDLLELISTNEDLSVEEFRRLVRSFGADIAYTAEILESESL